MSRCLPTFVDAELTELLDGVPAVAIEGPKGVGKTATALRRASTVFEVDRPSQRAVLEADPTLVERGAPPILLDEWQRFPPLWDAVRRAVDRIPVPGRFLLTESAVADDVPTHSGAGRIVSVRMRPLCLTERGVARPSVSLARLLGQEASHLTRESGVVDLTAYIREIVSSGFPAFRGTTGRAQRALLDGYLERIAGRDFPDLGLAVRRPAALHTWMRAYAAATSTNASYNRILDAATPGEADKPARLTTEAFRHVLSNLWILDPLPAWSPSDSRLHRLAQVPKHHLADPALAARLLGVTAEALCRGSEVGPRGLRDGRLAARLFESLVASSVRVYAQAADATVGHFRTRNGDREVDLVVERDDGRVLAAEVKMTAQVSDDDVRHLVWLRNRLGSDLLDAIVVTTGRYAYRRRDGIAVVTEALLGP